MRRLEVLRSCEELHCPPEELSRMLDEYYALRGWSKDGVPTPETLRRLGLAFAIAR